MNLQEKGSNILINKGFLETKSKSRKYRTFIRHTRPGYFYFIGKKGAVRTGKNVSSSISVGKVKK